MTNDEYRARLEQANNLGPLEYEEAAHLHEVPVLCAEIYEDFFSDDALAEYNFDLDDVTVDELKSWKDHLLAASDEAQTLVGRLEEFYTKLRARFEILPRLTPGDSIDWQKFNQILGNLQIALQNYYYSRRLDGAFVKVERAAIRRSDEEEMNMAAFSVFSSYQNILKLDLHFFKSFFDNLVDVYGEDYITRFIAH